jgi:hypothetical protein
MSISGSEVYVGTAGDVSGRWYPEWGGSFLEKIGRLIYSLIQLIPVSWIIKTKG